MQQTIKKYPVQSPLLKKYIKFFWQIRADHMQLDHKIIPVRNIDLKFNLSDTPHTASLNGVVHQLENVYFSGLQDHFRDIRLQLNGSVDVLGICFRPEGLYPFLKIPVSEFRNRLLGASEIGFSPAARISERLRQTPDTKKRLAVLEKELVALLDNIILVPAQFRKIFNALQHSDNSQQISEFCQRHNINIRTLERMYNRFVGVSPRTYGAINRFQNSINQLNQRDYSKLSDIAYDNGYFDQTHLIREFRRYTGNTPKKYVLQKNSMLQIAKMA